MSSWICCCVHLFWLNPDVSLTVKHYNWRRGWDSNPRVQKFVIVWITMLYKKNFHRHLTSIAVTDPGEGASPIFFRLNWDPKGPKKCFWDPPPSLGLDERSLLSEGLGPDLDGISLDWSYPFFQETWTFAKELLLAAYHGPLLYSDLGHLIIEAQKDGLIFSTCFWSIWWQRVSQSYKRGRTETSLHKANVIPVLAQFGT